MIFSGIALDRNRDEWMLQVRRMGSCPCKQLGRPIARFRSNLSGKCLAGRSAALQRWPIAGLWAAHCALHPFPARHLRDPEKIMNRLLEFLQFSKSRGNDLITPRPEHRFRGLKAGDRWCLCALRWKEAFDAGVAPKVVLESTHVRALDFVTLEQLQS